jgi:hypothetical protein
MMAALIIINVLALACVSRLRRLPSLTYGSELIVEGCRSFFSST